MAAPGPAIMNVIKSMAHGNHITLKVTIKKETFLPLLSCEYVYAMPRMRATGVSLWSLIIKIANTLGEDYTA